MASINHVFILGNLGDDPEIRSANGSPIATLSVATSRKRKDAQSDSYITETEWHRIVVFGRTAEVARDYLHKGSPVCVEGRLRTRKWQDKSGIERWTTEIICENLQLISSRTAQAGSTPADRHAHSGAPVNEDVPF